VPVTINYLLEKVKALVSLEKNKVLISVKDEQKEL